jgi:hypothetical protein
MNAALLLSAAAILASCAAPRGAARASSSGFMETADAYGLLRWDGMALFNNHWGMGYLAEGHAHSGRVSYEPEGRLLSWEWSWPADRPDMLKAYPALIIGDKPYTPAGVDESTDPRFPLHIPDMKELWFEGQAEVSGTGEFNFAFDLNLLDGPLSAPETVRTEIMVWLAGTKACGAKKVGEYVVDGIAYDLHINTDWNPRIPYLAFVNKGPVIPKRFPLHEFFAIAFDLGFFGPEAYLCAVELGAEIWHGEGRVALRDPRLKVVMR